MQEITAEKRITKQTVRRNTCDREQISPAIERPRKAQKDMDGRAHTAQGRKDKKEEKGKKGEEKTRERKRKDK